MIKIVPDKQTQKTIKHFSGKLPTRQIRSGLNRVIGRELKRVQGVSVRKAAAETGLKQKFLRKISGVSIRNGAGVFWIVARNFVLHRLGRASGGSGGVVAKGGALSRGIKATGAFIIRGRILKRRGSKVGAYFAATGDGIKLAFDNSIRGAGSDIANKLRKELEYRMNLFTGGKS